MHNSRVFRQIVVTTKIVMYRSKTYWQEAAIMILKSDHKADSEELKFISELGWFATLAIAVATFVPFIFD
jgi:hypothetical protein